MQTVVVPLVHAETYQLCRRALKDVLGDVETDEDDPAARTLRAWWWPPEVKVPVSQSKCRIVFSLHGLPNGTRVDVFASAWYPGNLSSKQLARRVDVVTRLADHLELAA